MKEDSVADERHFSVARLLKKPWEQLTHLERTVVHAVVHRRPLTTQMIETGPDDRTFGERLADKVASFGGSWTFIISFGLVLLAWVALNSLVLARSGKDFDPYPYILLNLFLSMLASIQAPIIMMSQNRLAIKDRENASNDYRVNLKAELEILGIHEKLDELRETKWNELLELQKKQIEILHELMKKS